MTDEVPRLPELLNEVRRLIEETGLRFSLTGSSARKLWRGGASLLAGRAWMSQLFPLTSQEIPDFDLDRFLHRGGLPAVCLGDHPTEELDAYVNTFPHEEVQAGGLVRGRPRFSRFPRTAPLANGQVLNCAKLWSDTGFPTSTVPESYLLLQDTLVGVLVEPRTRSPERRTKATARFFFFDTRAPHALAGTPHLDRSPDLYGRSFEHWNGMELRTFFGYSRCREPLGFWRSTHGHEVDFVLGDRLASEVKASRRLSPRDMRA